LDFAWILLDSDDDEELFEVGQHHGEPFQEAWSDERYRSWRQGFPCAPRRDIEIFKIFNYSDF
jgi:hypothetical protein